MIGDEDWMPQNQKPVTVTVQSTALHALHLTERDAAPCSLYFSGVRRRQHILHTVPGNQGVLITGATVCSNIT